MPTPVLHDKENPLRHAILGAERDHALPVEAAQAAVLHRYPDVAVPALHDEAGPQTGEAVLWGEGGEALAVPAAHPAAEGGHPDVAVAILEQVLDVEPGRPSGTP